MKIIFFICLFSSTIIAQPLLPPGWRYPNEKDITQDWREYQKKLPKPYYTSADFNNDGFTDEAWILFKDNLNTWGLFVFLKEDGNNYKVIALDIDSAGGCAQRMGISIVEPGEYQTACGKGYWDCEEDEPARIQLYNPSIDYFVFESASSIFYWDNKTKIFKRIWMSD